MESRIAVKWCMLIVCVCTATAVTEPARVIYVDAGANGASTGLSWVDACNGLQDALTAAAAVNKPVEICVAKGIYKPDRGAGIVSTDRTATFKLINGVTIQGGYAGAGASDPNARDIQLYESVLSGDLIDNDGTPSATKDDNSYHVVTGSGTDNTAVIDGFTITAGCLYPAPQLSDPSLLAGAGMLIDAGSPTILHCCFRDNYAKVKEILLACNRSNPVVTDCTFLNNQGVGMGNMSHSNSVLTRCRFEGNTMEAMKSNQSSPVITSCQFSGSGATVVQFWDCDSVLTDCVFTGGDRGMAREGVHCIRGRLTLTDCTLTGLQDGAMESPEELIVVRCTFTDNAGYLAGAVRGGPGRSVVASECTFIGNRGSMAGAISNGDVELHDCQFIGNSGTQAGAVEASTDTFIATGCVFAGNSSEQGTGAIFWHARTFRLSNCTFAGNRGPRGTVDGFGIRAESLQLTQSIVWDGPNPFPSGPSPATRVTAIYSDVQGGHPGQGNIDVDPCFVNPGYWADPTDRTRPARADDPNAVWIAGDYHLKSQAGHWDRASKSWARDEVTSLCIDAGDPNAPLGVEPFPNGGFVNLGAYGGTAEASKSYFGKPPCETQIAGDINGDCIVDQADLDILQLHWLMTGTGRINSPPTVTLLSPKEGDELTYPTPILLQSAASDSDGTVSWVKYTFEYCTEYKHRTTYTTITDPTGGWAYQWKWSNVREDGPYTIWAEAMDNDGAKAISNKITVTLHPAQ
jgi:hypothetical protein